MKGDKARLAEPFTLEPWQQGVVGNLFGWKRPDGRRRYRKCFLMVPRKNGKTLLAAGIALYLFFCDGEVGSEIYCAASDREQAALLFDVAKVQVLRHTQLKEHVQVFRRSIVNENLFAKFECISADADSAHGFNAHCVVVDELHAQANPDFVDVLETSMGARSQPLTVHITTSDYEREGSICNELHEYASKVRDGIFSAPSFLPVIYEAKKSDDWTSEETWKKANPNLGVSIMLEYLQDEFRKAQESPRFENTFKRLYLNIRTGQATAFINMEAWDACRYSDIPREQLLEKLRKRPCYAGLDLSATTDLSALSLVFPHEEKGEILYYILPYFWAPSEKAKQRERKDRVPYLTWASQGLLELTPGNVVDYKWIRRRIAELGDVYKIKEIAIDRWNAVHLAQDLEEDGFSPILFGQGFASMSGPTKEFEKLYIAGRLVHGGHPILSWMASHVAVESDAAENLKPTKEKSGDRIDGIVATIMGLGRALLETETESVYVRERRGLRFL